MAALPQPDDLTSCRILRVPARWFADVSANLCIANIDFAEFADSTTRKDVPRLRR